MFCRVVYYTDVSVLVGGGVSEHSPYCPNRTRRRIRVYVHKQENKICAVARQQPSTLQCRYLHTTLSYALYSRMDRQLSTVTTRVTRVAAVPD